MKKNFKLCILLLTIAFLICGCGKTTKTEETAEKQKDNHYLENKNLEVFDDTAIQKMLELPAVGEDAYYKQFQSEDAYEEKIDFEGIKADEPYQVRLRDADRYGDSCNLLIDVFIRSYMSAQEQQKYVSEDLTIFLYGGSTSVPFSALVSTDGGKNFTKTVISDSMDVRAEFVSVPENSGVIYVLSTGGRTMSQEGNLLYKSTDGGKSFLPVEGIQEHIHFITTDFSFVTEQNGFVCVRSSEKPYMLVTGDGGSTWTEAVFENVPEYYGMAYAPVLEDGVYTLYVGEEAYSKEEGGKYRFVSLDEGRTWERQK